MKTKKYRTLNGLARIISKNYANWAEVALCKDGDGRYLMGYATNQFPSSMFDEKLTVIKYQYETIKQILDRLSFIPDFESGIIRLY